MFILSEAAGDNCEYNWKILSRILNCLHIFVIFYANSVHHINLFDMNYTGNVQLVLMHKRFFLSFGLTYEQYDINSWGVFNINASYYEISFRNIIG